MCPSARCRQVECGIVVLPDVPHLFARAVDDVVGAQAADDHFATWRGSRCSLCAHPSGGLDRIVPAPPAPPQMYSRSSAGSAPPGVREMLPVAGASTAASPGRHGGVPPETATGVQPARARLPAGKGFRINVHI